MALSEPRTNSCTLGPDFEARFLVPGRATFLAHVTELWETEKSKMKTQCVVLNSSPLSPVPSAQFPVSSFKSQVSSYLVLLINAFNFGPSSSMTRLYSSTSMSEEITLRRIALRNHAFVSSNEPLAYR